MGTGLGPDRPGREREGRAVEAHGDGKDDVAERERMHGSRVRHGAHRFVECGDASAGEDADRREQRPEEPLASIAERVTGIGR